MRGRRQTTRPQRPRFHFIGGKGGVGKTTCAAAAGLEAATPRPARPRRLDRSRAIARRRLRCSAVLRATPHAARQGPALGGRDQRRVVPRSAGWTSAAQRWSRLRSRAPGWIARTSRRLLQLSLPGIDELAALLEISRLAASKRFDLIVVDTAPTGHTLRMLAMPQTLLRRGGRVRPDAREASGDGGGAARRLAARPPRTRWLSSSSKRRRPLAAICSGTATRTRVSLGHAAGAHGDGGNCRCLEALERQRYQGRRRSSSIASLRDRPLRCAHCDARRAFETTSLRRSPCDARDARHRSDGCGATRPHGPLNRVAAQLASAPARDRQRRQGRPTLAGEDARRAYPAVRPCRAVPEARARWREGRRGQDDHCGRTGALGRCQVARTSRPADLDRPGSLARRRLRCCSLGPGPGVARRSTESVGARARCLGRDRPDPRSLHRGHRQVFDGSAGAATSMRRTIAR